MAILIAMGINKLDRVILYLLFAYALVLGFSRAGLHIFSGLVTVLVAIRYFLQPFPILLPKSLKVTFILFWGAMALSIVFANDLVPSIKAGVVEFYHFIPVLYVGFFLRNPHDLKKWTTCAAVSVFIGSVIAIWQGIHGISRAKSFLGIMDFAGVIGLIIPIILVAAFRKEQVLMKRFFFLITILVAIIALLYNGTRAVWLSTLCVMLLFLIVGARKNFKTMGIVLALLFFAGSYTLLNPNFLDRAESISNTTTNTSNVKRLIMWQDGIRQFRTAPITGVGIGNVKSYPFPDLADKFKPNDPNYGHVHNTNIQMLAETGIIGFLAYLLMMAMIFYQSWTIFRQRSWENGLIICLCLVEFIVHGMFDTLFYISTVATVWWLLLGIYLSTDQN